MPGKWTKTDLKSCRGAIDHWWTGWAMYLRPGVTQADVFAAMPAGERQRIVVAHFRGFASMLDERVNGHTGYRATHEHATANPHIWGNATAEIVERFRKFETETLLAIAKTKALADRVEAEGLPSELETYIPE